VPDASDAAAGPTLETVRALLIAKKRAGHTDAIRGLLQKYGVTSLRELDPAHYEALLADAERLAGQAAV